MADDPVPLLERFAELDALGVVLDRAAAKCGGAVLVEGAAGIGKSSLLAAVAAGAAERGMRVLRARGTPLEQAFTFGVSDQLFDRVAAGAWPVRHLTPSAGAQAPAPTDELAACHGLYWLSVQLADVQPLCLLVDDAHWADEPSLRFVDFLARRLDGLAIAVVVAARGGSEETLVTLRNEARVLRPGPLSKGAVVELVGATLGDADVAFCQACHESTGGNPFLLAETLREAAGRGLSPSAGAASVVGQLDAPRVTAAVEGRLRGVSAKAVAVAHAAAILQDGCELRLAAAVAQVDLADGEEAADELARAAILLDERPLRFVHPLIGAAVSRSLTPGHRAWLHERAGRLLADEGVDHRRVAAHLLNAEPGAVEGAARVLAAAARSARGLGATTVAVGYLERALREPLDESARAELLAALGSSELALGRGEALAHLREAHDRLIDPVARARLAPELVRAMLPGDEAGEALAVLDDAADAVRGHDPELAAGLFAFGAMITETRPELQDRVRDRLVRVTHGAGTTTFERIAFGLLARHRMERGEPAAVVVPLALRALQDETEATRSPLDFLPAVVVLVQADELDVAARVLRGQRETAVRRGAPSDFALASALETAVRLKQGALREAEGTVREAMEAAEFGGWQVGAMSSVLMLSLVLQGDLVGAETALQRTGLTGAVPNFRPYTPLLEARGRLRVAAGAPREGLEDLLETLVRTDAGRSLNPVGLDVRVLVVRTRIILGEEGAAREMARDVGVRARAWGTPRALGLAYSAAALLERGVRRVDGFSEAERLLRRTPDRLEHAGALTALGSALRRANRRAEARPPLRAALELARACHAWPVALEAEAELKATGARPRKVIRTGVDELTPTERRIADQAASGASNAEIARTLFVAVKTVEMHLSSAYRKLDIGSRADLRDRLGGLPDARSGERVT